MKRKIQLLLALLVSSSVMLAACGPAATSTSEPGKPTAAATNGPNSAFSPLNVTGDIVTAGSSTVFPLSERMSERFRDEGFSGNITVDSIGSGAGLERFCEAGETDIANSSRAIHEDEIASCEDIGRTPIEFRVGTDALAIVVSQENDFLTDLTLEPNPPMDGSCGHCRICLDKCPTGAIIAPFVVDARRCISYLTIELRGWIPRELRPLMGTWVYGCDVCQDVCPHNTLVRAGQHAEFAPRRDVPFPDLLELLHLDERTYQERFRHSAIKRAKRQGLRRNAAVALGNLRDRRAVPALCRALEDEDALIRGHAAWALGQIGGDAARAALQERALVEADPEVLAEVNAAVLIWGLHGNPR